MQKMEQRTLGCNLFCHPKNQCITPSRAPSPVPSAPETQVRVACAGVFLSSLSCLCKLHFWQRCLQGFHPFFGHARLAEQCDFQTGEFAEMYDPRVGDLRIEYADFAQLPKGFEVGYDSFSINGRMLGHGEPIKVKAGERVMFHVLNASATEIRSLALPGHRFTVVALDGNPVPTLAQQGPSGPRGRFPRRHSHRTAGHRVPGRGCPRDGPRGSSASPAPCTAACRGRTRASSARRPSSSTARSRRPARRRP